MTGRREMPSLHRAALVVAVLVGVLAMHGLPATALMSAPAMGAGAATGAQGEPVLAGTEAPMGCGADHVTCTAVMRADRAGDAPPAAEVVPPAVVPSPGCPWTAAGARSRAPPNVSLTGLCISRT